MKVSSVPLVIAAVACGGSPARREPVRPEPARVERPEPIAVAERTTAPARAEPRGGPGRFPLRGPGNPADWLERPVEEVILRDGRSLARPEQDVVVAESAFWDPCVRRFVAAQPEPVRRALTTAFARLPTACDRDDRVVLQLARGIDGRERRGRSDVGFVGSFTAARTDLSLRVAYCGEPAPVADHIVIASDDARWSSTRLDFERDEHGCEVAELPATRTLLRVLRAATEATDMMVRFEGRSAEDLVVGDDMKQDLRVMLDALEALAP